MWVIGPCWFSHFKHWCLLCPGTQAMPGSPSLGSPSSLWKPLPLSMWAQLYCCVPLVLCPAREPALVVQSGSKTPDNQFLSSRLDSDLSFSDHYMGVWLCPSPLTPGAPSSSLYCRHSSLHSTSSFLIFSTWRPPCIF